MKKFISILSATFMLVASFTMFSVNSSTAKVLKPDYDVGKKTLDNNCNEVFVCPHTDGTTYCV